MYILTVLVYFTYLIVGLWSIIIDGEDCNFYKTNIDCTIISKTLKPFPYMGDYLNGSIRLSSIYFTRKNYQVIRNRSFEGLSIEIVMFSMNRIQSIEANAFSQIKNLSFVVLYRNILSNLTIGSQNTLTKLNLEGNELSEIRRDTLYDLPSLIWLNLKMNLLEVLELTDLPALKELDASNNKLREFRLDLPNLRQLTLSENYIEVLEDRFFNNMRSLQELILDFNAIYQINLDFKILPSLKGLLLSNNNINDQTITSSTFNNTSGLLSLRLDSNRIQSLSIENFGHMKQLKTLDISSNNISAIPDGFWKNFPRLNKISNNRNGLTSLDVSDLSLESLSTSFNYMKSITKYFLKGQVNLIYLDFDSNQIHDIDSDSFRDLACLRTLILSNQLLSFIKEKTFVGLYTLENLLLDNNRLKEIKNNSFGNLNLLAQLKLNGNKISFIESNAFNNLSKLKSLDLSRNRLSRFLGNTFRHCKALMILDLYDNQFKELPPKSFYGLEDSLVNLTISLNRLEFIKEHYFMNLTQLGFLYLSRNSISSIEANSFAHLPNLGLLDLSHNCIFQVSHINLKKTSLVYLYFSFNMIGDKSNQFTDFKDLSYLYLDNNQVYFIHEDTFKKLPSLTDIFLQHNFIRTLNLNAINTLSYLTSLDLSYNPIESVVGNLTRDFDFLFINLKNTNVLVVQAFINHMRSTLSMNLGGMSYVQGLSFSSVRSLYLSNVTNLPIEPLKSIVWQLDLSFNNISIDNFNRLTTECSQILELNLSTSNIWSLDNLDLSLKPGLLIIDLSHNQLKLIKKSYFQWNNALHSVYLSHNSIEFIESGSFYNLQGLTNLDLSNNNLKTFGQDIFGGNHVPYYDDAINLSFNFLEKFDFTVQKSSDNSPDALFLQNNQFKVFPQINQVLIKYIKKVDVSHNQIEFVPRCPICQAKYLNVLSISNNKLTNIEKEAFSGLNLLTICDLSKNRLAYLENDTFKGLIKLNMLNLSFNEIEIIQTSLFAELPDLEWLDLSYNSILFIEDYSFSQLNNLRQLYLNSNPLKLSNIFKKTETLIGLDKIKIFYMSASDDLTLDNLDEIRLVFKLRVSKESPLEVIYYDSISLVSYHALNHTLDKTECFHICYLIRYNIQFNLFYDFQVSNFINSCNFGGEN